MVGGLFLYGCDHHSTAVPSQPPIADLANFAAQASKSGTSACRPQACERPPSPHACPDCYADIVPDSQSTENILIFHVGSYMRGKTICEFSEAENSLGDRAGWLSIEGFHEWTGHSDRDL